jgi:hypothetical protein
VVNQEQPAGSNYAHPFHEHSSHDGRGEVSAQKQVSPYVNPQPSGSYDGHSSHEQSSHEGRGEVLAQRHVSMQ